ncbi:TetR family transcriptional regulator [Deinococcus sp.]|uniref:TetR family transcriptional regulator n=1 Tax=Deinococcus sp. TaxID=47478 RepID=UPI003C7C6C9B
MKRDAQATRQRIFEAATAEFARYGIAGARIDRIAAASGSNKAMIYTYFGSKDALFNAVGVEWISRNMNDVPVTAHDLPEFAARLFDQYQKYPEMIRLVTWAALERGPEANRIGPVLISYQGKLQAIRQAQEQGVVSDRFSAETLLELILALIRLDPGLTADPADRDEPARRRRAIKEAVARLAQPD